MLVGHLIPLICYNKIFALNYYFQILFTEPDTTTLIINDIISKDEGLYSVSARNVAGTASSSAMLHVEENDLEYNIRTYSNISPIKTKKKLYNDFYDIGDELGRGTQGITYHAVERLNGEYYYLTKTCYNIVKDINGTNEVFYKQKIVQTKVVRNLRNTYIHLKLL